MQSGKSFARDLASAIRNDSLSDEHKTHNYFRLERLLDFKFFLHLDRERKRKSFGLLRRNMPSSVWKGYISFGLISVPVRLYSAARYSHVAFHEIHRKCGTRVHQQLYCPYDKEVVS